ncbi:conserved membrane hypothetical protein [Arthrobacter sp. 9AX]|uniref:hypothetical protein n=1 Tax=Arthrobacter sp. 9AX TaxID=2653131 RepID=UPI0012F1FBEB|nr:hypothetical protein [Arthrobacter sp. 9AX]VXC37174.1 conserved membrane hypothetical protein [Arthrobacter sp. 9AX]
MDVVDILAGVSSDWLKHLTWIVALAFAAVVLLLRRPWRPDQALLAGFHVFIAASLAAGIYVLNHLGEGRWGGDKEPKLDPPSFSETPMVGQFLEPLDGALSGMADVVNELGDFRAAFPVALDFFVAAGWALAAAVPAGLCVLVGNAWENKRRRAESAAAVKELARLRAELESVKQHVGYGSGADII